MKDWGRYEWEAYEAGWADGMTQAAGVVRESFNEPYPEQIAQEIEHLRDRGLDETD